MAKKTPAQTAAPIPGKLDLWHKGLYPALALLVGIAGVIVAFYFGSVKQAAEKEVERLKTEVKQHAEQEQRAKDETQWLRVEIAKEVQKEKTDVPDMIAKAGNNDVAVRAAVAVWLALHMRQLDTMKQNDAAKFGEQVKELWDKALKQAEEEKPIDWAKM
jgi:H+/gluconate symporter-like permease